MLGGVKAIVLEKNPFTRAGLVTILKDRLKCTIQDFDHPPAAIAAAASSALILLDPYQFGYDGCWAVRRLREQNKTVPILALTSSPDRSALVKTYRAGASGVLLKTCTVADFHTALDALFTKGVYMPLEAAGQMIEYLHGAQSTPELSDRENEVMHLLGNGQMVKQIALELGLSVKSISTYRTRILKKLNLRNTAEIMRHILTKTATT